MTNGVVLVHGCVIQIGISNVHKVCHYLIPGTTQIAEMFFSVGETLFCELILVVNTLFLVVFFNRLLSEQSAALAALVNAELATFIVLVRESSKQRDASLAMFFQNDFVVSASYLVVEGVKLIPTVTVAMSLLLDQPSYMVIWILVVDERPCGLRLDLCRRFVMFDLLFLLFLL